MTHRGRHSLKMKIRAGKATAAEIARYEQRPKTKIPPGVMVKFPAGVPTEKEMRLADRAVANASAPMRRRMMNMTPQAIAATFAGSRGASRERASHASRSAARSTRTFAAAGLALNALLMLGGQPRATSRRSY